MRTIQLGVALVTLVSAAAFAQTTADWPTGIGFQNIARTPGQLVAGPIAVQDGRHAIIAWHNGVMFTIPEVPSSAPGSNFQARMWNLSDTANPRIIARAPATDRGGALGWSLGDTPMPINAHGYFHVGQNFGNGQSGHWVVLGPDWPPAAPWSFRAQIGVPGITREASGNLGAGTRGSLFAPWHVDETWWSYSAITGLAALRFGGPDWNPGSQLLAQWDHLGQTGVIGHPFLLGNLLIFASDQSRTGVATYDVSDPTQPILLDVLNTGGPGGYWPELWGNDGELYVVFPYNDNGNGIRVVDASDPSNLRFVGDTPLARPNDSSGAMYGQFQDEFAFIGDHKIDMRTRQSVLQFPTIVNDIDIGQFALPLGNLLIGGGTGSSQAIGIFAHQADPDTRPPSVAFHIPRAGQSNYARGAPISLLIHETLDTLSINVGSSLLLRQVISPGNYGASLPGTWTFSFDDVLTFQPSAQLAQNSTYEMRLNGIRDAAGNAMPSYAFTFSTGAALGGNRPPTVDTLSAMPYPAGIGVNVDFSASASDPDGDGLQYRYDFGDGSAKTAWAASAAAQHAYAVAGHYRAAVQVRDPSGVIASRTRIVTVASPPANPVPTQSSSIHCATGARRVYVANPDSNTVSVLDADSALKLAEFPTCADPRSVALSANGQLWVSCVDSDRVQVLNASTGALIGEIDTGYGSAPLAVVMNPAGSAAFVSMFGKGELRRYDTVTRAQTGLLVLGPKPRALAVSGDGSRVFATRFLSPRHHGEVWEVNAATLTLVNTHRINKFGDDANRDTTASGKGVLNQLAGLALSPRTGRAFIAGNKPNSERGLLIHASQDLDTDNTLRNLLVELDPAVADPFARTRRAIDVDNSDSASALSFSPLGDYLFVTLQGMDEVIVFDTLALDAETGLGAQVTRLPTGAAPQGVCVDAVSERTFVQNLMGRSVTVIDSADLFRAGDIQLQSNEVDVVSNELMPSEQVLGKRLFYHAADSRMSAEGYLSCASCHLDGGEDGRVWDFSGRGEGLRNTTTLNGRGGMAHGQVHWSANFDEIQDFENDIRLFFGGNGFLSDPQFAATQAPLGPPKAGLSADLDALAAYVGSLDAQSLARSPFRLTDGGFSALAQQGESLLDREGCTGCHVPPRYTDSGNGDNLHDVGTLRASSGERLGGVLNGIDTPTLRGLAGTAPYFHDGSATSLTDVFRVTGGATYAAESASAQNGASLVSNYVDLNNDDSVRGRAYVALDAAAQRLVFSNVDGGSGGLGAIELRFSNSRVGAQTQAVTVRVNGVDRPLVNLPASNNSPTWRSTNWDHYRIDGIPLNAGAVNTIEISTNNWYLAVDEILVATPSDLTLAQPHRRVSNLPPGEQDAILAFLRELDGSSTPLQTQLLFQNGFE